MEVYDWIRIDNGIKILPGSHSFPFRILFKEENLPAPFKNQYSWLQYNVVSYMRHYQCYVPLCEKPVTFKGYLNLVTSQTEPLPPDAFKHESSIQKSIFPAKKSINAVFELLNSTKGHLPGDEVLFQLNIPNPKHLTCTNFSVGLVKECVFKVRGAFQSKSTSETLATFECLDLSNENEVEWIGSLKIPDKIPPSYEGKSIYNVKYFLEV